MATEKESKLDAGVPKSKLKVPPNNYKLKMFTTMGRLCGGHDGAEDDT